MTKKCPHCGAEMPEESRFCLQCMQYAVAPEKPVLRTEHSRKRLLPYLAALLAVVLLLTSVSAVYGVQKRHIAIAPEPSAPVSDTATPSVAAVEASEQMADEETASAPPEASSEADTDISAGDTTAPSAGGIAAGAAVGTTVGTTAAAATRSATESATTKQNTTAAKTTAAPTTAKNTTAATEPADSIEITNGVLRHYPSGFTASRYTIPKNVTKIANNAFSGNRYITELEFSDREELDCNYANLFASLPNLKTIYIYPGTGPDLEGKNYFTGKVVYL